MRLKFLFAVAFSSIVLTAGNVCAQTAYQKGKALFDRGMYERAADFFDESGDPLSMAYSILCAAKLKSPDYEARMSRYMAENPESVVNPLLHCQHGMNLFDSGLYELAAKEFDSCDSDLIDASLLPEFTFKRGYCSFTAEEYDQAVYRFNSVLQMPYSVYSGSSQYFIAYISYLGNDFTKAEAWFGKTVSDPRFAELSAFYILECRFMRKDYRYVVENGPGMFADVPEERQERLSRLLSESFLVLGDKTKALEYFRKETADKTSYTRSDYFHAGSVLYGASDYDGAIENFSKMTDRTDSLGQIANYQLGYSYVRKGNKVAALDSFNDAAKYAYDARIQEDAAFNYAKLAFDLNHDPNGFKAYLAKYSTSVKGEKIYSYMAIANLYNRDYAGAIEAYENIETLDDSQKGNYVKANYLRATQLMAAQSWSDAIPYLRAAGFYYPKSDRFNQLTRYWLGQAYFRTEKYDDALRILTDLYNTSALFGKPEGRMLPYDIAYCNLRQDNLSNASRWFEIYLASGAKDVKKDALLRRADCDFLRRDYKAAEASYQREMDEFFDVNDIYPYYRQALSFGLAGDKWRKVEALSKVKDADSSSPLYSEALYELGRSYLDVSDNEAASASFELLRSKSKDSTYIARSLIGLGMVNRNSAQYDRALEYYKAVIEMMPGGEFAQDALLAIESIYQTKKQPEQYLAYVEAQKLNANKTPQERARMYFNTAEQVFLSENYQNAVKLLGNYIESYPDGENAGEAVFYLAESYKALGNKEKACVEYAKVPGLLKEGSFVETSILNAANISFDLERYSEAYAFYKDLKEKARMENNKKLADEGMLHSAYYAKDFESAINAADCVEGVQARYIKAKSLLAVSRRDEAIVIFRDLARSPSTSEGAESAYILIQDAFDRADYGAVESGVYDFSRNGASQSYWLAKAYLVLGDSFAQRGNTVQAKTTYESIRDGYAPRSADDDVQDNVKLRLERLQSND